MKNSLKILAFLLAAVFAEARGATQPDSTLRIDYVLAGDPDGGIVAACSSMTVYDGWYGRRHNHTRTAVEGAADIVVTDNATGDTLYIQPFCTLFQEWLVSGDNRGAAAMEGTIMVPMPAAPARATVTLRDNSRRPVTSASFAIDPADILTARRDRPSWPLIPVFTGKAPESDKVRVAIIAEGFTDDDMDLFTDYAARAADAILSTEPFASAADHFDFVAVAMPSEAAGVSIPALGVWADTALGAHFSTFYSDRYLTAPRVWKIYDAVAAARAEHAIVLANTDLYGGSGILNFYTITAAGHRLFDHVVVHEFAHSFAGLADEYHYDDDDFADGTYRLDIEPWEGNITTLVNFTGKWEAMVESGEASLVEGAGYRARGIYRSAADCRMRSNDTDSFCPACRLAISRMIELYVNDLDAEQ